MQVNNAQFSFLMYNTYLKYSWNIFGVSSIHVASNNGAYLMNFAAHDSNNSN